MNLFNSAENTTYRTIIHSLPKNQENEWCTIKKNENQSGIQVCIGRLFRLSLFDIGFSGGLELLFDKITKIDLEIAKDEVLMKDVIAELHQKHLKEKPELFIAGNTVFVF